MKKYKTFITFLFFLLLFSSNTNGQQKFGYVRAEYILPSGELILYCSDVIDLSTLDCNNISRKNNYGTDKSKIEYFSDCIKSWFSKKLKQYNLSQGELGIYPIVKNYWNNYGCAYDNEDACFFLSKQKALDYRKYEMETFYKKNAIVFVK